MPLVFTKPTLTIAPGDFTGPREGSAHRALSATNELDREAELEVAIEAIRLREAMVEAAGQGPEDFKQDLHEARLLPALGEAYRPAKTRPTSMGEIVLQETMRHGAKESLLS
jgi:hypothetical protein